MVAANIPAYDGWLAWHVVRLEGKWLDDLRRELATSQHATDTDA